MFDAVFYFAIAILAAGLLNLAVVPVVHQRAVRLATRRIDATAPRSLAEIVAEKDQLRAEFAMSIRRLEIKLEELRTKSNSQLTEIAKRDALVRQLKNKIGEQSAAIVALEAQQKALRDQMRVAEEELSIKSNALIEAQSAKRRRSQRNEIAEGSHQQPDTAALVDVAQLLEKTARAWQTERAESARLREAVDHMASQVGRLASKTDLSHSPPIAPEPAQGCMSPEHAG
jgi:chromosome segregation ATPase